MDERSMRDGLMMNERWMILSKKDFTTPYLLKFFLDIPLFVHYQVHIL